MALNPIDAQVSITTSGSSTKSGAQAHKTKYLRVVAKIVGTDKNISVQVNNWTAYEIN